ncbi:SGNH/GDSL hydrolase family protein [Arthrobacter sp. ov407]|uniref:SGNH/GDSL hydrolase family protein n=1 Tax=Arthrobacter sp. ov407 TaxID=1761748 RepID=UPI00210DB966|nr:SGNH/GDSL hydrolase family protein [Arthrobacter sp. ov407]
MEYRRIAGDVNAARFLEPDAGHTGVNIPAAGPWHSGDRGSARGHSGARRSRPWSRYVALGDSFTAGVGDPEPLSPGGMRGWADRIAEELGEGRGEFGYANLAISGLVLREILDQQLGPALSLKPDLVTLSAGGNDLVFHRGDPDRMAAALDDAVAALSATGATVVLFTGPDWGETAVFGHIRGKVAVFNENIRVIAARHDVVIADLWALRQLSDPRMWDPDRLHFSPLGHHTIAAMVLDTLSVPHRLRPLEPKPMPPGNWREARAGDLAWMAHYMLPWVVSRIRPRADALPRQAKRPLPGPPPGVPDSGHKPLVRPGSVG